MKQVLCYRENQGKQYWGFEIHSGRERIHYELSDTTLQVSMTNSHDSLYAWKQQGKPLYFGKKSSNGLTICLSRNILEILSKEIGLDGEMLKAAKKLEQLIGNGTGQ